MLRSLLGPAAIAVVLASGCVYPAHEPTGLELSWRFFEGNQSDGDEALRVRSCAGADVDTVLLRVYDDDDEARLGTFRFPCESGFQTVNSFQTAASEAFLELGAGLYRVELFSWPEPTTLEFLSERAFDVASRGVTVEPWVLTRPTFDWTLELTGMETCDTFALDLLYDDPAAALPEHVVDEEDTDAALRYRDNLSTDLGLRFGAEPQSCTTALQGTHVVPQMDRGDYRLQVTVGEQTCTISLALEPPDAHTTLDLSALPCDV